MNVETPTLDEILASLDLDADIAGEVKVSRLTFSYREAT